MQMDIHARKTQSREVGREGGTARSLAGSPNPLSAILPMFVLNSETAFTLEEDSLYEPLRFLECWHGPKPLHIEYTHMHKHTHTHTHTHVHTHTCTHTHTHTRTHTHTHV